MILILCSLIFGILIGATLKIPPVAEKRLGLLLSATLFLMLGALGAQMGANSELVHNLPEIGWRALLLAALAVAGSLAALFAAERVFRLSHTEGEHK